MFDRFAVSITTSITVNMTALEERININIAARLRSSSPTPTPPQTQSVTQSSIQKKRRNKKTRLQYKRRILQQANVKSTSESTLSSNIIQISLLSIIQYWIAKQVIRETAYLCSNTSLFICQYTPILLAFQYTSNLLALSPGYIEYIEEIEVIG